MITAGLICASLFVIVGLIDAVIQIQNDPKSNKYDLLLLVFWCLMSNASWYGTIKAIILINS